MLSVSVSCSGSQPATETDGKPSSASIASERKYSLERVDDAAVVQIYADGFSALPLREKTLIWHLSQAAIAGRDIFYDQIHRNSLEMRRLLEAVIRHPQGIGGETLGEIRRYTKLFWINSVTDVKISYPMDLTTQMLEFSSLTR